MGKKNMNKTVVTINGNTSSTINKSKSKIDDNKN
jgi:hypothetical protein